MSSGQFETRQIGNVRLHVCPSTKFKTTMLVAMFQQELSTKYVTQTALLSNVLLRGTEQYPTMLDLKKKQNDLYGAGLFGDVFKRGERQILHFGVDIANEQYLHDASPLLEEAVSLLCEVITKPALEQDVFMKSYIEAEKRNRKQQIEGLVDDKIQYAAQRSIEAMCKNEPYAIFINGRVEDLPAIQADNLYTYYQELLYHCPLDFYCVGDVDIQKVVSLFERYLPSEMFTSERNQLDLSYTAQSVQQVKTVVERLPVNQGKLNMGCRTHITVQDSDYSALLMYNGILGGFPHSKLFMNVREKASLAYYASSRLESHKGIMHIQSGIEIQNFEKAVTIIKEQMEVMRQGQISDQELEQTKATLSNQFREQQDRAYEMIQSHYHSVLSGTNRPLEQILKEISHVSKEDVQKVAQKIQLDTIYFLRDQGGEADEKN
ncbi:EF-P 5-aminopentanol modification-associated protein YfmF [Thermoactinomyces sp. DSM 45892]|uniref:EF-P 5-aminopentanol modification-associated protein YfmF n=1 Tax=Thermoactinomyces sp. DSM 45892 TaxID=1882753 RepID=UPI0008962B80|nr:pitrilysin family protein [Thermoactinomyces sp. DSM 45892]SDY48642.1 Predicted Zn-dependent peptidase [Thermoactinomyces sp. DSM 45892]